MRHAPWHPLPSLRLAALAALSGGALTVGLAAPAAAEPAPAARGWLLFQDEYALPNGFAPEGIAVDVRGTAYVGSLVDGDIYALDLFTGEATGAQRRPGHAFGRA